MWIQRPLTAKDDDSDNWMLSSKQVICNNFFPKAQEMLWKKPQKESKS